MLRTNLSTRPFYNQRAVHLLLALAGVVVVVLTAFNAIRIIALSLGFWSVANDPATTPQRWVQFARLAWATGYRIAHHIDYAISQKNNHSMTEAVGLMLIAPSGLFIIALLVWLLRIVKPELQEKD